MRIALALCIALLAAPAFAQGREQTLADIRQELSVLFVEIQRLRGELNTTGSAQGSGATGPMLDRLNAIEAEVQRLNSSTERLQLNLDRVVRDGTNRIGDLEFRLCELEADCNISQLSDTPSLGGVEPGASGTAPTPTPAPTPAPAPVANATDPASSQPALPQQTTSSALANAGNLAVAERSDFERAQQAFDAGNYADAAVLFQTFANTYPGGPLSAEAHFMRGQSEANVSRWNQAARAFLESFSIQPDGPRAPAALTALGVSLNQLGQTSEACLTLDEVGTRFPGTPAAQEAQAERGRLNCQ